MIASALKLLSLAALAIGVIFNTLGVVGILRFPDVYTRLHADTKATTFGTIFTALSVVLFAFARELARPGIQFLDYALHVLFAVIVLAVTNATAAHALARAAHKGGLRPKARVDALAERGLE
jgi:multicomponent Na+:H+ antiporter subunit G